MNDDYPRLSDYDRENLHRIMAGRDNHFSAELLRLIPKADPKNRARLRSAFPEHVAAFEWWWDHSADEPFPGLEG